MRGCPGRARQGPGGEQLDGKCGMGGPCERGNPLAEFERDLVRDRALEGLARLGRAAAEGDVPGY